MRKPVKKKAFKRAKRYKIRNSEEIRIQYTEKCQEREILKTAEVTKTYHQAALFFRRQHFIEGWRNSLPLAGTQVDYQTELRGWSAAKGKRTQQEPVNYFPVVGSAENRKHEKQGLQQSHCFT